MGSTPLTEQRDRSDGRQGEQGERVLIRNGFQKVGAETAEAPLPVEEGRVWRLHNRPLKIDTRDKVEWQWQWKLRQTAHDFANRAEVDTLQRDVLQRNEHPMEAIAGSQTHDTAEQDYRQSTGQAFPRHRLPYRRPSPPKLPKNENRESRKEDDAGVLHRL